LISPKERKSGRSLFLIFFAVGLESSGQSWTAGSGFGGLQASGLPIESFSDACFEEFVIVGRKKSTERIGECKNPVFSFKHP
jgi:hypothetical protein